MRLEEILEEMNSGEVALDASLKLYEEADKLIGQCGHHLQKAEQKIEKLIKNREGEVELDDEGQPLTEPFSQGDDPRHG
jgi:exodeoxyribonuclease VII small subunit